MFVFCAECGCSCMISICVSDKQSVITDCMTAISINADRPLLTIWGGGGNRSNRGGGA